MSQTGNVVSSAWRVPQGLSLAVVVLAIARSAAAQQSFEAEPIKYYDRPSTDAVARLQERIDAGAAKLAYDPGHGYLPAVLEALKVPVSSQALVFSKTSFQLQRISPKRPRALYFNDDVYVGWCQGGDVMEFAAIDPVLGTVFYTLDQEVVDKPRFVRDKGQCLSCHASSRTQDVPGVLVRSVYPDRMGQPVLGSGTFTTDHTSPLRERWGGWYVTGTHGAQRHMGNGCVTNKRDLETLDMEAGANVTDLAPLVDMSPYLSKHSDIVALMILEHQTQMHNLITRAAQETLSALHYDRIMNEAFKRAEDYQSPSTQRRIDQAAERLVEYMLMRHEAALTDPIRGTSEFAREFSAQGPRDRQGRSLRDLDLEHSLFKYSCSYLIYSTAFQSLPTAAKDRVYERLWRVLSGEDMTPVFGHLAMSDRRAILEILRDTLPDLPPSWASQ